MRTGWFVVATCLLAGCVTPPGNDAVTVIANVTVVDAVQGAVPGRRVVVRGDRIVEVGAQSGPVAADETDGSGRFLMPGLWDMHVHYLYDADLTEHMADLFLRWGVTSVRDTGGELAGMQRVRRVLAERRQPSPRLYFSGPLLDGKHVVYDGGRAATPPLGTPVPDERTARARVREMAEGGASFIKIYEMVSVDVFLTMVDEARALGLPIAAHIPLSMTADVAGPEVDSMEHLRNIELACAGNWQSLHLARMSHLTSGAETGYELRSDLHRAQRLPAIAAYDEVQCAHVLEKLRGTLQVPTLRLNGIGLQNPADRTDWNIALGGLPGAVQTRWLGAIAAARAGLNQGNDTFGRWSLDLVARMRDAGVPIAAGTDTPIGFAVPGYSLHNELDMLVRAGLTTQQALAAATTAPPRFFGFTDEGQIAPGMRADLVLLEANPLEDITHTRRIERVMVGGRWVPR